MNQREEIVSTLLEWYEDVLNSWNDGLGAGDYRYPRLCPAYNHPSYKELDRLLDVMRSEIPVTYWNISQRYLYAPSKVVMRCPRCGPSPNRIEASLIHPRDVPRPSGNEKLICSGRRRENRLHGPELMRPVKVRIPSRAVRPDEIRSGISWLAENFAIEPTIPNFEARHAA